MSINQVIGRCIRNQYDYGAVFLIDDRFSKYYQNLNKNKKTNTQIYRISEWCRHTFFETDKIEDILKKIEQFYTTNYKKLNLYKPDTS
jgi:hypothetical protein